MADVGGDLFRDGKDHLVRQFHAEEGGFVFDDGHAGLKIRRRHIHQQAPFEPGPQAVVQQRHLRGGTVGGQHDLAAGFVQVVEGMEKFLLGLLLAGDELHVIHQQQVRLAVFFPHFGRFALPDGVHQLVRQVIALDVSDFRVGVVFPDDIGDGVDQVGLSQAGVAVNEQGVVVLSRVVGHCLGCGVGKLVGRAHHERFKGEFIGCKAVVRLLDIAPKFLKGEVVQNLHLKIRGEDVVEDGFDVFQEQ